VQRKIRYSQVPHALVRKVPSENPLQTGRPWYMMMRTSTVPLDGPILTLRDEASSMRVGILIAALALGCSHYGWADRNTSSVDPGRSVGVHTISIPPDRGVNADAVTQRLVGALQRSGWPEARWSNENLPHVIQCSIGDFRDHAFGAVVEVSVTISCSVGAPKSDLTLQRRVEGGSWLNEGQLPRDLHRAYQEVSMAAVESIVWDLSHALEARSNHGQT
jgi:hypothetical protein